MLIGQTIVEIRRYNGFREPSTILFIISVFKADRFKRHNFHYRINSCRDRSSIAKIYCNFSIFMLLAVTILDIQKFEILTFSRLLAASGPYQI